MNPATAYPWWPLLVTLLTLVFSQSPQARPSSASSTVTAGRPLAGGTTIESQGGNFVLGFFSPGESHNFYLGIWFKKIPKITPVWVANRVAPLRDHASSELVISGDGNLVLLNQDGARAWSTNLTSVASNSTVAELLDIGNLVLRDGHNSSRVIWQSFDHPTDTWLPGSRLALNKVTGEAQRLVSWKNSEDPAPGIYSLGIDPKGGDEYSILWNGTVRVWSSGNWTWTGRFFSNVPEMGPGSGPNINFTYISNEKENYFTYSSTKSGAINRMVLDLSGQARHLTWVDDSQGWMQSWAKPKQCEVHHLCGPFGICNDQRIPSCSCLKGFEEASPRDWALGDPSGGCTRRTPLQCEASSSGDQDKFYALPNMGLPKNPQPWPAQTAGECEFACWSNCSCTAYSYDDGCSMWHQGLFNLMQMSEGAQDGKTLYLRLAALELQTSKPSKRKTTRIAIGAATGALAALAFVWVLIWRHRRRRRLNLVEGSLVRFSYGELKRVTKNFSKKLGGGGFGSVFKGTMPDSTQVAVKRLEGAGQGEKQFRTEVSTIGTIQHVNLVRLRGFCSERSRRLLVYHYMPKGSLGNVLFHETGAGLMWKMRYKIILGTARGLAYLHEKCRDCIIHCDIKPENILLDDVFVPKVADFGLAKLVGRDFSRVLTTIRGTRGYLAPEWISGVAITVKADVYSYGMMVFEIVSGRRNSEEQAEEVFRFFPSWAAKKLMTGEVLGLLDPRLEGVANLDELNRVFRVAYWCIQDDEKFRPSMGQVVQILEGVLDVDMPPMPKYLQLLAENVDNAMFFSNVSSNRSSRIPTSDASTSSMNQSSTPSASNH